MANGLKDPRVEYYLELLEGPTDRWQQEVASEATDRLWCQVAESILGRLIEDGRADCVRMAALSTRIDGSSNCVASSVVESTVLALRVVQRYWGIGVAAAASLEDVTAWAGTTDLRATTEALSRSVELFGAHLVSELTQSRDSAVKQRCEQALHRLSGREREVVQRRFGVGMPPETLEEIGRSHHLTRERIRQIEARALKRLGVGRGLTRFPGHPV